MHSDSSTSINGQQQQMMSRPRVGHKRIARDVGHLSYDDDDPSSSGVATTMATTTMNSGDGHGHGTKGNGGQIKNARTGYIAGAYHSQGDDELCQQPSHIEPMYR